MKDLALMRHRWILCLAIVLVPGQVSAQTDVLRIIGVKAGVVQDLVVNRIGAEFQGTWNDGTVTQNVFAAYNADQLFIQVGFVPAALTLDKQGTFVTATTYGGVLTGGRAVDFDAFFHEGRQKSVYEGFIGSLHVSGATRPAFLYLTWNVSQSILILQKLGSGNCAGALLSGGVVTQLFCQSSGSMTDALFNDHDQMMAWLVNLFVK